MDERRKPIRHPLPPVATPVLDGVLRWRDRVALAAGLAYGLGYASRALHAWDFNFGALPGARFDYVIAGLLLLVPSAGLAALLWLLHAGVLRLQAWSRAHAGLSRRVQDKGLSPFMIACLAVYLLCEFAFDGAPAAVGVKRAVAVAFLIAFVLEVVLAAQTPTPDSGRSAATLLSVPRRMFSAAWSAAVVAYFGLLLLLTFFLAAFVGAYVLRFVPQEFGGVRPKCAVLDLAQEQLSPELASLLVAPVAQRGGSTVQRSRPLDVYSTSGPWLVRVPQAAASGPPHALRLSEQVVRSVEWLTEARTPAGAAGSCARTP
jgi:hypothetical protein